MTDLTLETLREELAPIRAETAAMRTEISEIQGEIAAMRTDVDGIPLMQRAIDVIRRDVRSLHDDVQIMRDDLTVVSAIAIRLDNIRQRHERILGEVGDDVCALRGQIARMDDSVRKLEDAQS